VVFAAQLTRGEVPVEAGQTHTSVDGCHAARCRTVSGARKLGVGAGTVRVGGAERARARACLLVAGVARAVCGYSAATARGSGVCRTGPACTAIGAVISRVARATGQRRAASARLT
jgi:hypothetical protein